MKLVIINGSPRKDGATFKVLNYFKESLTNVDADIDNVFLKPFMLKNKEQYSGILKYWLEKGIT